MVGDTCEWTAVGYARVSTLDQNEKRQFGVQVLDRVFTKASGGDIVVPSLDRLARSLALYI
jgi:DNA invertase Pin-like site-specific DNA recombinase